MGPGRSCKYLKYFKYKNNQALGLRTSYTRQGIGAGKLQPEDHLEIVNRSPRSHEGMPKKPNHYQIQFWFYGNRTC